MSKIIPVSTDESIRIEQRDGTVLQLPASAVLAVDKVLREATVSKRGALVTVTDDFRAGAVLCRATVDERLYGVGKTAWAAIVDLAMKMG